MIHLKIHKTKQQDYNPCFVFRVLNNDNKWIDIEGVSHSIIIIYEDLNLTTKKNNMYIAIYNGCKCINELYFNYEVLKNQKLLLDNISIVDVNLSDAIPNHEHYNK